MSKQKYPVTMELPHELQVMPARDQSREVAVRIPLELAAITGSFVGMAAAFIAALLLQPVLVCLFIGGLVATIVGAGAWLLLLTPWSYRWEQYTGLDLNQDGQVGEPAQPQAQPLRVIMQDESGRNQYFYDFPPELVQTVTTLARAITTNQPYATEDLTGEGHPLSKPKYNRVRNLLIQRKLAIWINDGAHAQGWQVTERGRRLMERIAASPTEDATGQK